LLSSGAVRSRHVDKFNHDLDAAGYDAEVCDESDPIRAGYAATLRWVADAAAVRENDRVLDLGSGTGNLTALIGPAAEIVCVDVSREMAAIARTKLDALDWAPRTPLRWIEADLLEALDAVEGDFDAVVSTYAVHHLTEDEKTELFADLRFRLRPGGRAVFGDLMFASATARGAFLQRLRTAGDAASLELAETIEDEFFWDLERAATELGNLGFAVKIRQVSELSWGVAAELPPRAISS
jgi:putative AdoMet-dependent methyltransferase